MKIISTQEREFNPIKIEITLDSQYELEALRKLSGRDRSVARFLSGIRFLEDSFPEVTEIESSHISTLLGALYVELKQY